MLRLYAPTTTHPDSLAPAQRVVDAYLLHLQARVLADDYDSHGYKVIKSDLTRFAAFLGIQEPRRNDIADFLAANPQIKAAGTKDRIIKQILACWHWAVDDAELTEFCYRRPKTVRAGKSPPRREATATEYRTIMAKAPQYLRDAVLFLDETGCRPGEMRKARWPDVLWAEGLLILPDHKTRRKTGQPRQIGLNRVVLRLLRRRQREAQDKSSFIFVNALGEAWKGRCSFQTCFRRCLKKIGLDRAGRLTPACFRNTWAGRALDRDVPERKVADQLGHTTTNLVHHYGAGRKKLAALPRTAQRVTRRG